MKGYFINRILIIIIMSFNGEPACLFCYKIPVEFFIQNRSFSKCPNNKVACYRSLATFYTDPVVLKFNGYNGILNYLHISFYCMPVQDMIQFKPAYSNAAQG